MTKYKNKCSSNNDVLLKQGKLAYEWALDNMKIVTKIQNKNKDTKPLSGYKLGFCLHLTKETSVLLMAAKSLGAMISICSANPLSVKEEIVEFLKYNEIEVFAKKNQKKKEFYNNIFKIISKKPDIIIDDGAELHNIAHNGQLKTIIGGTEETTSGILRILALQLNNNLKYPIIGVNNARTKHLFDNRYGTGQSTIDGLLRTLGVLIAGKHFVVCGYGWVGKGISSSLRGLGAKVTITEVDPIRALEAHLDGFNVEQLKEVLPLRLVLDQPVNHPRQDAGSERELEEGDDDLVIQELFHATSRPERYDIAEKCRANAGRLRASGPKPFAVSRYGVRLSVLDTGSDQ